jgi:hypothetical protein
MDISERDACNRFHKEKRVNPQPKKRKQNLRRTIARELDRDVASVDSEKERKWLNRIFKDTMRRESADRVFRLQEGVEKIFSLQLERWRDL